MRILLAGRVPPSRVPVSIRSRGVARIRARIGTSCGLAVCGVIVACGMVAAGAAAARAEGQGAVQEYRLRSRHQDHDRRIWIYTPPGYEARRDTGLGLVVVFDGDEYRTEMPLPRVLDSLQAAGAIPPQLAVLIDDSSSTARLDDLANRAWFVDFLGNEVIPWVRQRWPVSRDPRRAIVTGSSAGGLAAAYAALSRPDLFGNVLSQSGALWRGAEASNDPPWEWLVTQAARWPRRPVRLWLEVGDTETRGALGGRAPSILAANRAFRDTLRSRGYEVTYIEVPHGVHAPATWGPRLPIGIAALAGRAGR